MKIGTIYIDISNKFTLISFPFTRCIYPEERLLRVFNVINSRYYSNCFK